MADIFREIDEELQQERAAKLWQRYGDWLIALAVGVVLLARTGGKAGGVGPSQGPSPLRVISPPLGDPRGGANPSLPGSLFPGQSPAWALVGPFRSERPITSNRLPAAERR